MAESLLKEAKMRRERFHHSKELGVEAVNSISFFFSFLLPLPDSVGYFKQ